MFKDTDKVIFLDTQDTLTEFNTKIIKSNKVKLLNPLLEKENVYLMLLKPGASMDTMNGLRTTLLFTGLKTNRNIIEGSLLCDKVESYVKRNKIKHYVVISSLEKWQCLIPAANFVLVDGTKGLSKSNMDQAELLLNSDVVEISTSLLFDWRTKVIDLMKDQDLTWATLGKKIDMDRSRLRKTVMGGNITIKTIKRIFDGLDHVLEISVEPKH